MERHKNFHTEKSGEITVFFAVEESTNLSSNALLCLNKISISTTLEEVKQAFIQQDISFRNIKTCNEADGSPMTLIAFAVLDSSDRDELLKSGLVIKDQRNTVRDYINRDRLIHKCFTCNKIGHLTKNCKTKVIICPKFNTRNFADSCPKSSWKCTNCGENYSAAYKRCPSFKTALAKSLNKHQNLSYAKAVCRRTAKVEIKAFKANIIVNVNQLIKIITTVLWGITGEDFSYRDHLAGRLQE